MKKERSNKLNDVQNNVLINNILVFSHLKKMQINEFAKEIGLEGYEAKKLSETIGKNGRLKPSVMLIDKFVAYSGFNLKELTECRLELNATFKIPHEYLSYIKINENYEAK